MCCVLFKSQIDILTISFPSNLRFGKRYTFHIFLTCSKKCLLVSSSILCFSNLFCVLDLNSVHPPLLGRTSTFRGGLLGKRVVTFFRGWVAISHKKKLKSEMFSDKKSLAKFFFSVITKNSNWEVLPKNLVTINR